ncbi:MAG: hypothetical protein D6754_12390 [Alphaproteobacteria bacterium]|nr:MAG: hypothetical protein D6754_12390 [Alphaproteobacteria bacterium]
MTGSHDVSPHERAAHLARIDAELREAGPDGTAQRRAQLHLEAAGLMTTPAARRFQLTHAWIWALSAGDWTLADRIEAELRALGGL